jgi:hypothetical protein
VRYDLLRSGAPSDFTGAALCAATGVPVTWTADDATPGAGRALYYLARAVSGCAAGVGPIGAGSDGVPRAARACP